VDDPRSTSQQKAARDVATRDAQQAKDLAQERRQREQAARGQQAIGIKPADSAASAPARKAKPKAQAKEELADPKMSPLMRVPTPAPAPATR
jgi:hypothetical protein